MHAYKKTNRMIATFNECQTCQCIFHDAGRDHEHDHEDGHHSHVGGHRDRSLCQSKGL